MPYIIRLSPEFVASLESAAGLLQDEVTKDAFLQLQSNPFHGGGNLLVMESPNPTRPDQTHFMFLERTNSMIAYRVEDNTVYVAELLPGGEV